MDKIVQNHINKKLSKAGIGTISEETFQELENNLIYDRIQENFEESAKDYIRTHSNKLRRSELEEALLEDMISQDVPNLINESDIIPMDFITPDNTDPREAEVITSTTLMDQIRSEAIGGEPYVGDGENLPKLDSGGLLDGFGMVEL